MRSLQIVRSDQTLTDMAEIWFGIATANPTAATRVVEAIDRRILSLSDFPELGSERLDIAPGLRVLVEGNYLILYRVGQESVEIVRVIHGARDISALL